ncbi:MAG: Gfo/Idh/MocA family oxidoreductase [Armatimonadota bacterium]
MTESVPAKGTPIRVGVVGLGRSGYDIHLKTCARLPHLFQIAAVCDGDRERLRSTADEFSCAAYATPDALFAAPDIDLVVVATTNITHAEYGLAALHAGKHLVAEKPLALTTAEVDAMIAAAESTGRVVAPFYNLRFDESFNLVRDVLASGKLGRILQIRLAGHSYTRRWDWQTLRSYGGGQLYNLGSHLIDLAMALMETCGGDTNDLELFCDMRHAISSGDAEDHARLTLRARSQSEAPLVDVELTSACAFPQDRYLVMGTLGGLRGTPQHVEWKWLEPAELTERSVQEAPTADRSYNREDLPWHREERACDSHPVRSHDAFYNHLFGVLRRGEPLIITPESIRRRLAVVEHAQQ